MSDLTIFYLIAFLFKFNLFFNKRFNLLIQLCLDGINFLLYLRDIFMVTFTTITGMRDISNTPATMIYAPSGASSASSCSSTQKTSFDDA
jgi:hypothetical protein